MGNLIGLFLLGSMLCTGLGYVSNAIKTYSEHRLMEKGFEYVCGPQWYSKCEWKHPGLVGKEEK